VTRKDRPLCGKPMYGGEACARLAGHRHRCLTRYALDNQRRYYRLTYIPEVRRP
jgi:hypothetical protein